MASTRTRLAVKASKENLIVGKDNRGAVKPNTQQVLNLKPDCSSKGGRSALSDIGNSRNTLMTGSFKPPGKVNQDPEKINEETTVSSETDSCEDQEESTALSLPALPESVADIDVKDSENPQLCSEYAPLLYAYLRQLESGLVIKKNFLKGCPINGKMRGVLVDWLIEVHTQFKLLQETLFMTVYIIDKYLQAEGLLTKRNQLQLVGVTAMFIASKVEEMYAPEMNDFVYITDNSYTAAEIRKMELKLLNSLGFNLTRPLPLHFLRRNSKAGDVDVVQHSLAKYIMEASLLEYELAHQPPSLIAGAALFLSLRLLEPDTTLTTVWSPALSTYSTYSGRDLLPLVCKMAEIIVSMEGGKLQAVKVKYSSKKFLKVAELEELTGDLVKMIARRELQDL